ncbi:MAG: hypothetical protein LBV45_05790, partial [Xanthomonadaceae bacterium]|nr:hypothetical protein [Xanthomonadaceae bacterium]
AESYLQGALIAAQIPDPMFTIEGHRMAGFCYQQGRRHTEALDQYLLAIRASLPLSRERRATTTLSLVLQDMLQLQNKRRAWILARYAEIYQTRIAQAHTRAEHQAMRFGAYADKEALGHIEADMHLRFEKAFQRARKNRERIIAHSDEFFRKIVAAGRLLLHPAWSGLPDIKHPLDKDIAEWCDPPEPAELPDPGELIADATSPEAVSPTQEVDVAQAEEIIG